MQPPALFKERQVWLPTFFGFCVIAVVLTIFSFFVIRNVAAFLAENKPIAGRYLVVEGWVDPISLLHALNIYKKGNYEALITTGGPIIGQLKSDYKTHAESAAAFIRTLGFDNSQLNVVPAPASAQNRTFLSAVMVREWFAANQKGLVSMDVFSDHVHARRTHLLYKMAFSDQVKIGIISAPPNGFKLRQWWKTSIGARVVFSELLGFVRAKYFFYPGELGSHQEKWGIY
ncbi:MAG: hypothetical protein V3U87_12605 [Methylococcaceae bacterium]